MRYPEGHKHSVRARIVEKAARALRRDGLGALSIPALMKEAGLTHGGFYGYFKSRNQLLSEAVLWGAEQMTARVLASKQASDIHTVLDAYLSEAHAKHPEIGCVIAALGSEGRKQPAVVRRAFAEVARDFLSRVDSHLRPVTAAMDREIGAPQRGEDRKSHGPLARSATSGVSLGPASQASLGVSPNGSRNEPSDEALRLAARMIGAIVLARLIDEPALSRRLLEAARRL